MLSRLLRSRLAGGAAALVALTGGSVVFASGSSAGAPAENAAVFGPVVPRPVVAPLFATDGPLLLAPAVGFPLTRVVATPARPEPVAARPPQVPDEIGPDSSLREIRALQRLLNARGASLRVDGAWGPATAAAVRRLQESVGLPVDGRVGPRTAAVLRG